MIVRLAVAVLLGAATVLASLLVMQSMIATARGKLEDGAPRHFVDFVRVERDESVQTRKRQRQRPPQPEAPPQAPLQPRAEPFQTGSVEVDIAAPQLDTEIHVGGFGGAQGDGEYLPIVKIAPVYPMSARRRRIEGHVIVEYTVTRTGGVRDVRVIEAEPPGVFDHGSVEAALKFRYKPRVIDGTAIEVHGVRNIFRYRLEED